MFRQYEYFSSIMDQIQELKTLGRVTGLMGLEEAIENQRSLVPLMLMAEDEGSGYLSLDDGNLDYGFHTFYIMDLAKLGDSRDRHRALDACMAAALNLMRKMMLDSREFGQPCYGIDWSRIDYQRIGPMINNSYGYMFTYVLRNENFHLAPKK